MRLSAGRRRISRRAPQEEEPKTRLSPDVVTDILTQRDGVGLIDGRLYFLDLQIPDSRRAFVQLGPRRLSLREGAPLDEHWRDRLGLKLTAGYEEIREQPTGDRIGEFVASRLIPYLQELATGQESTFDRPVIDTCAGTSKSSVRTGGRRDRLAADFLLLRDRWWNLSPIPLPNQPAGLKAEIYGQLWLGYWRGSRRRANELIRGLLNNRRPPRQAAFKPGPSDTLYQDGEYSVVRKPDGPLYCCRHVSSFAVEGPDRKLYFFPPVRIGIALHDLNTDRVVEPRSAVVMEPYRHMFLSCGEAFESLCISIESGYFQGLWERPLEEALVRHLETARQTLCSGYFQDHTFGYHHVDDLGLPRITAGEARRKSIPVYPFYRN